MRSGASSFGHTEDALGQLLALECAVRSQIVALVASLDIDEEPWRVDGATTLTAWLAARFGLSQAAARELVDVSRRLQTMPDLAAVFGEGRLSWDQLRVAVRAEVEADDAVGMTPEQLARAARQRERVERAQACESRRRRSLRFWNDRVNGMVRVSGALSAADGEIVRAAVSRLAEHAPPDADTGVFDPWESRCADALVDVCSARLAEDADADRATVVIHVAESALAGRDGVAETSAGLSLSLDTIRRRLCDSRWQTLRVDEAGRAVGVGRLTQSVPPWLRRIVRQRDGGRCRFQGCGRTRLVEVHHLWHWEDGGPTNANNLVSLCRYHHHLLHEGGWDARGDPDIGLRWVRPDGSEVPSGLPPLRDEIRARVALLRAA